MEPLIIRGKKKPGQCNAARVLYFEIGVKK